jgi:hypothetical protein
MTSTPQQVRRRQRRRSAAAATAGSLLATGSAGVGWRLLQLVPTVAADRAGGPAGPLLAVAACAAAVVCARLALTALACTCYAVATLAARCPVDGRGAGASGRRCAQAALLACPAVARPVVALVVAGGLTLGTAAAASAAAPTSVAVAASTSGPAAAADVGAVRLQLQVPEPGWSADPGWSAEPGSSDQERMPSPGWTPDRPAAPPRAQADITVLAAAAARAARGSGAWDGELPDQVVVRRGDSLWSIVARQLGSGATDADVAEQWPRWWHANRRVIGDDPDVLLPGQVLHVPTSGGAR